MTQSGQHDHSPKNLVQVRIKELAEGLMSQQGGRKAFLDFESYCFLRTGRRASKIKPGGVQ